MLNVPNIQPDEWIIGYLERLAILNGYQSANQLFKVLKLKDKIGFVANLLKVSTKTIVQEYTLLPLFRSIVTNHSETTHGDPENPGVIKINWLRGYSEHTKICPKCVNEDIDYLGYLYIRRSHQIFGAERCDKHDYDLVELAQNMISDLIRCPSITTTSTICKAHNNHPVIKNFLHICDALLSHSQPIHGDCVSFLLSKRASILGIRTSMKGRGVPLSDYANQHIPHTWLHKHFPILAKKSIGEFINAIDGVCVFRLQSHTPMTYILAASLLFEDPDSALNCLLSNVSLPPAKKVKKINGAFWNSEELFKLYIKHKGNCQLIAKELGGHYDTIRLNLIKNGLPPLTSLSIGTLRSLMDFHDGQKLHEILCRNDVQFENFEFIIRHSSPKFFIALKNLHEELNNQRKALQLRLNKKKPQVKAPQLDKVYFKEKISALEQP